MKDPKRFYQVLIKNNADRLNKMTMINHLGQTVDFLEHPTKGDEVPVIVAFTRLQMAFYSDFYEIDDMIGIDDYQPYYDEESGTLKYGIEESNEEPFPGNGKHVFNEHLRDGSELYEIFHDNKMAVHVYIKDGYAWLFPSLDNLVKHVYFGEDVEHFSCPEDELSEMYKTHPCNYYSMS